MARGCQRQCNSTFRKRKLVKEKGHGSKQLFSYSIIGFALTEAIALFGLMMSFLILFAF
jgi:F0F1-type ATP synthase membrane subunit c/vacuolar-type H+-ATPase subunit K